MSIFLIIHHNYDLTGQKWCTLTSDWTRRCALDGLQGLAALRARTDSVFLQASSNRAIAAARSDNDATIKNQSRGQDDTRTVSLLPW
jgi:hypothetical protein